MELLNRTEVLTLKKDFSKMAKAMEAIAAKLPSTSASEKSESVSDGSDPFFGKLHISDKHLDALKEEYGYKVTLSEVGLMEECSELIQALSKRIRATNPKKDNIIEEMAHVITCIRLVCLQLQIKPEDIQREIYKKYPDGYDITVYMADNEPYYVERRE